MANTAAMTLLHGASSWRLLLYLAWIVLPAISSPAQVIPRRDPLLEEERRIRHEANRLAIFAVGRPDAALAMARRAVELKRQRTNLPISLIDRQWLIRLKNEYLQKFGSVPASDLQTAQEMAFRDKWLTPEKALHDGGKIAIAIASAEKELQRLGQDHPESSALRESVAASEKQREELLGKARRYLAARKRYFAEGKLTPAVFYSERVADLKRQVYGINDLTTAVAIAETGRLRQIAGNFVAAVDDFEKSFEMMAKIFPAGHWRIGDARVSVTEAKLLTGELTDDAKYALDARRNAFLSKALLSSGEYYKAMNIAYGDVAGLRFKGLTNTTAYAIALTNFSAAFHEMGRLADAVKLQRQALETIDKVYQPKHPDYIEALNRLTLLYRTLGDVDQATKTARRSVALCEQVWGPEHVETAVALRRLADSLLLAGNIEEGRPMLVRSLQICEKNFRRRSTQWTDSLHSLASVDRKLGRLKESRRLFMHVIKNWKASGQNRRVRYVDALNSLAAVNLELGRSDEAVSQWKEALQLAKVAYSAKHPRYARLMGNLAQAHRLTQKPEEAAPLIEASLEIMREQLNSTFSVLSERQQLVMTRDAQRLLFEYLSLAQETDQSAQRVYSHALAWKGAVLSHQQRARASITDPKLFKAWNEFQETSRQLATLALAVPSAKQKVQHARTIGTLSAKKEALEGQLAQAGQKVRGSKPITVEQLQASLPKGTALVDFVQYEHKTRAKDAKPGPLETNVHLAAFVVRPQGDVIQIHLGPLKPIRTAAELWRGEIIRRRGGVIRGQRGLSVVPSATKETKRPQDDVRRLVWQPLEKHLAEAKTVLISPDGAVARIPLAALPGRQQGKYLIEELALAIVPVPSQLPKLLGADAAEGQPGKPSLLIVGDVDFGAAPGATQLAATETSRPRSAARTASLKFAPLPGTAREMVAIAKLHRQRFAGAMLTQIRGAAATESRLRMVGPKHRYLHLATHGFFAPTEIRSALARTGGAGHSDASSGRTSLSGLHPGLLSGIALAGANRDVSAEDSTNNTTAKHVTDDGVLTALEVAAMDLRGVELACLSACETGLGQSAAGEGVLGLQRAFQVAGADATLTSLWKVDDTATQVLMTEFYRNLWEKKLGKLEALRQAQLTMLARYEPSRGKLQDRGLSLVKRKEPVADAERLSPNFWAAFLLSGDWR